MIKFIHNIMPKATQSKKVGSKKTSAATKKKSSAKGGQKKELVCAEDAQCFWVCDGTIVAHLAELRDALKDMPEEVYAHHVTKEKNDFADWAEEVLKDPDAAEALRKSRKPSTARTALGRVLKNYNV